MFKYAIIAVTKIIKNPPCVLGSGDNDWFAMICNTHDTTNRINGM